MRTKELCGASCTSCNCRSRPAFSLPNNDGIGPPVLDLFECPNCKMLQVGNDLSEEELARVYSAVDSVDYYRPIDVTAAKKADRAVDDLSEWVARMSPASAVLDIGCGAGHFLGALRARHPEVAACGHELDEACASACRAVGFEVTTAPLESLGRQFGIVTMLDVAEHVRDPTAVFDAISGIQAAGSFLYLHTPRRCAWDSLFVTLARLPIVNRLARVWLMTRVSIAHLRLWTDKALISALDQAGFEIVYFTRELELSWPLAMYPKVYLQDKLSWPPSLVAGICLVLDYLLVRLGTMRIGRSCWRSGGNAS